MTVAPTARALLVAIRSGDDPATHRDRLAGCSEAALRPLRADRRAAVAFWLNLYNAGTQLLLRDRPALYDSALRLVRFFRAPCVTVATHSLSLDDIEHGILRGGRSKYGLGYLPRLASSRFVRRYAVDCDPRIHFALNCGAASCPAIRAYERDAVDDQLDRAVRAHLDATVEYDPASGRVRVPKLFRWYRGDFGGRDGIYAFLRRYDAIPPAATPRLRYADWDWSRVPRRFAESA